jgi:hypothetical protein
MTGAHEMEGVDMTDDPQAAFDQVAADLLADPDADVRMIEGALAARGRAFALLLDDRLVVDLPIARAADLVRRTSAAMHTDRALPPATGRWISAADSETWDELAAEAHRFVAEPPVGHDS